MSNWLARIGRVRPRPPDIAAVLTQLGGVAIAFALAMGLHGAEHERARSEFLQRAETRFSAVSNSFGDALDVLHAANALFESVGAVSGEQFGAFVRPLMQKHPYLDSVVFHRAVEAAAAPATKPGRAGCGPASGSRNVRKAAWRRPRCARATWWSNTSNR
jgi:CHASE1-domain containing sensor protein